MNKRVFCKGFSCHSANRKFKCAKCGCKICSVCMVTTNNSSQLCTDCYVNDTVTDRDYRIREFEQMVHKTSDNFEKRFPDIGSKIKLKF